MIERDFENSIESSRNRKEKVLTKGVVTKVYEKSDNDLQTGNIELDVLTRGNTHQWRRIPFISFDHPGHTYVPQVGDHVLVDFMTGRRRQPVVIGCTYTREDRAPHGRAGHWRHEFDSDDGNIYLEAEPTDGDSGTPNVIRIAQKPDGVSEPTTTIELDISGGSPTVRVDIGDDEQGIVFDGADGSFSLLDQAGYGITSDGDGNFEWYHKDVNYKPNKTTTLDNS